MSTLIPLAGDGQQLVNIVAMYLCLDEAGMCDVGEFRLLV
jgi:hypothetical protein